MPREQDQYVELSEVVTISSVRDRLVGNEGIEPPTFSV
jgi:hypothetical protein